MNQATLARVEAHVFRTPIREPVRTSFGTMTERAAVFVRAEDSDGALFSLVVGNDPEVILLVEKGEKPAGGPVWQFGLVLSTRSTSVAMLDGREVWRYDSADKNPSDPRGGYLSVHGIATLPLEPPRPTDKP